MYEKSDYFFAAKPKIKQMFFFLFRNFYMKYALKFLSYHNVHSNITKNNSKLISL